MKFTLSIIFFFIFGYNINVLSTKIKKFNTIPITNDNKSLLNDITKYYNNIQSQIEILHKNEVLPNEVNDQLKDLNGLLNNVYNTQQTQKQKLFDFSNSLEQTKLSLLKMLSDYENRIDQLEYNIMESKKYDPFIENFKYPISKYWLKINLNNLKSNWRYYKSKNYIAIKQEYDLHNHNKPSTILLLKHHKLIDGYINTDILLTPPLNSKINYASSGVIFHFINSKNFRFVELSFLNDQAFIIIGEILNDSYKKIVSKNVNANINDFNTITCEFIDKKINIFLNFKKIIEINTKDENINNEIGLFTREGTAEFKNIVSGSVDLNKILNIKGKFHEDENLTKITLNDTFRFFEKFVKDNLTVYEIPYEIIDYDDYKKKIIDDVYPVPESDYKNTFTLDSIIQHKVENTKNILCTNYFQNDFDLNEWKYNTLNNWRVKNEFGINRITFNHGYKTDISKASIIYKYSSCNSATISTYIKLEYNSEAGIVFRFNNEDMYIVTISSSNKQIVLKTYKNNVEKIIKSVPIKNINTFQRHFLSIHDQGQMGIITVFLDNNKMFTINNDYYYKSGFYGFYVEQGYATFDTFQIKKEKQIIS